MAYTANVAGVTIATAPAGAGAVAAIAYTGAGALVMVAAMIGVAMVVVGLVFLRVAVIGRRNTTAPAEDRATSRRRRT
jgi:hypothetical protein